LRPWLDTSAAGGYLPGLLRKHGLDLAGAPIAGGQSGAESFTRRLMRSAGRRAYEFGVRTVEPRIKRWAQL
jgi:3-hydroxyisobutyrate dehydrogenase-like beta-hydroxyacid dehydrogenase